jgi:RNA polymerase sigma-70 factor (ECF subfamily)
MAVRSCARADGFLGIVLHRRWKRSISSTKMMQGFTHFRYLLMSEPPSGQTPPSLLLRLRNPGDREAWELFVRVYGPLIFGHARRRGLAYQDAEDVTQKVFVRISEAIRTFEYERERGRFRDWLGLIVRNEVFRHWKINEKQPQAQGGDSQVIDRAAGGTADPEWSAEFHTHILQTALERCRPHFEPATWRAFERVWLDKCAAAEVAIEVDRPIDWVYVAKSRVLKMLWQEVQELAEDAPLPGWRCHH